MAKIGYSHRFETPIEQQLDMNENDTGPRGDEVQFSHGKDPKAARSPASGDPLPLDRLVKEPNDNHRFDMSEEGREGDELTGDEHSSGLQGDENEGVPGSSEDRAEREIDRIDRERSA